MPNSSSIRQVMDHLHTWVGLFFGSLLFLVFFMGTLSVFDKEIDQWMIPSWRLEAVDIASFDQQAKPHLQDLAAGASHWAIQYPNDREPYMWIGWSENGEFIKYYIDPARGSLLPAPNSLGASGFFFPFHYYFHIKWKNVGIWLLAITANAMLVVLISGIIIHRRIFKDFFTFRPFKHLQRATLDLHNATSILLLPFHFVITFSGLVIFLFIYTEPGIALIYGSEIEKSQSEIYSTADIDLHGGQQELASVDGMVAQAQEIWGGGAIRRINIRFSDGGSPLVDIQRLPTDRIGYQTDTLTFDGSSGQLLQQTVPSSALQVQQFFSGLHLMGFQHWGLRWLYFLMGLGSCVMIGTGFMLWIAKRARQQGTPTYRLAYAVALATTTGLAVATLAMLCINKALPPSGVAAQTEVIAFLTVWLLTLVHPLVRIRRPHTVPHRAILREQLLASAILAFAAIALNWAESGLPLWKTLNAEHLRAIGVMDLVLAAIAIVAGVAAGKLNKQQPQENR